MFHVYSYPGHLLEGSTNDRDEAVRLARASESGTFVSRIFNSDGVEVWNSVDEWHPPVVSERYMDAATLTGMYD